MGGLWFSLPVPPTTLELFIANLYDKDYAPSTVNTYLSALAYFYKLSNFPDPTKSFFIMQMLKGYRKKEQRLDTRLPITLRIFHKLVDSAEGFSCSICNKIQFRAMCLLAFYAFLRVGEMTAPKTGACPPIQLSQLTQLIDSQGMIVSLKLSQILNTIIIGVHFQLSSTASSHTAQSSHCYFKTYGSYACCTFH